ncbi:MAG: adenylate/guanylate cyclase domain-containing protein [Bryobacteraceae bacterium]
MAATSAAVALTFGLVHHSGVLEWLESRTGDWRVRATADPARASRDLLVIDIDNASFRALTDKLGRWPWTRRVWTELIRHVSRGKPGLILFDALFSGAEPEADEEFAAVLKSAGNVVLPFALVSGRIQTDGPAAAPPASAAIRVEGAAPGPVYPHAEWSVNGPNPQLASAIAAAGNNLWTPDADGVTRRLPLVTRYLGRTWANTWLAAALQLKGPASARFDGGEFRAGAIRAPIDTEGRYVIAWYGDPLTVYRHIPLWEMICSIYPDQCDASVPKHAPAEFAGKIVVIGASAAGSYEVRPTAVSETAPGYFVLATALDNLLHNHAVRRSPAWLDWLAIAVLAAVPGVLVLRYRSALAPLVWTAGVAAAYVGLCYWLYAHWFWMPMAAPVLAAAVGFSGNTAARYFTVNRELAQTRGTLERYVSPQLVRHVMNNLDSFRFDGERRKLTIFFSDVRSFTTLTEQSEPVELIQQLNEYLEAMTDIVFRYEGIVDKFIGDGIMAHWGAFTPDRPNAQLAARAALEMMERLRRLNESWQAAGRPTLDIGIGMNTAEVIFGNIGTGRKSDFTVIGDGVNLAARLESANKEYHTHIIVSEFMLRELGAAAQVRPLGSIVVKGKTVPVEIYELLGLAAAP